MSAEGTLVVRQIEPFLPESECIVVTQSVLHGVLPVLHIKLNHSYRYQSSVFNRYFFALKLEPASTRSTDLCYQLVSLRDIPKVMKKESTDEAPTHRSQKCAEDVIKGTPSLY